MKITQIIVTIIFALVILVTCKTERTKPNTIKDIIQTVNIVSGTDKTILLSDLFYSDIYDVDFIQGKNLTLSYDKATRLLTLFAKKGFSGMEIVSFKLHGEFGADWGVGASYELKNKWEVGITYRPDNTVARLEIPIFTYD